MKSCDTCKNREVIDGLVCCLYMGADCQNGEEYEPQTNADRMIAMIQNGQVRDLLDWWEEIFEDGVPGDDYFAWWLELPVKDGEDDVR